MPRYAKNINAIYISERMQETLRHIKEYVITTIIAPMGYGKSTAALWFLDQRQKRGDSVFRINIYSSDVSLFWQSFCSAFRNTELGERLKGMDFPAGQTAINMFIHNMEDYLNTLEKDLFLLVDDCHLMEDSRVFSMLLALCDIPTTKLHIILVSRSALLLQGEELHLGSKLYRITVNDMRLNQTELSAYLSRCGVELPEEDLELLFRNSEGWFSLVYLNICSYKKDGVLLSKSTDIYTTIGKTLYSGYDDAEQQFLLDMCLADEFTVEQAEFITKNRAAGDILKPLIQNNSFIRYLPDANTYRFHHILKGYVEKIFAGLPDDRQQTLKLQYAKWHESQGQYIQAIRFYRDADARPALLHVIGLDRGVQLASIPPVQVLTFLECCSEDELLQEPQALLVLMRRLFSWQQIPKMLALKELVLKAAAAPSLTKTERNNLLGECDLIMSFLGYNDIAAMSALHQKAAELMTENAISIGNTGSYTFGSPSVLMMFHRESGKLSHEVETMNRAMPFYYQVTDHHGLGAEQIMEAEALYNRGELTDAAIMLKQAKDVSKSEQQLYIPLCCDFLEHRLALLGETSDHDWWYRQKSKEYLKANDPMIFTTLDGCAAYLSAITGQTETIPEWLAEGRLEEANLLGPARPMFEIIYNQVLLANRNYIAVAARGKQLLKLCRTFPYLLCEIHLHIQLAIANNGLQKLAEAKAELQLALDLALPDGILIPFAENGRMLKPLFGHLPAQYHEAVCRISELSLPMGNSRTSAESLLDTLTERERTIAALYASGKTRKEIADELFLSEGTVKNYISTLYNKLHITGTPRQKQHTLIGIFSKKP